MNKKFILLFTVLIISINGFIFAQNFNLKYYSSMSDDFSGVAVALYLSDSELEYTEDFLNSSEGTDIVKLTKNNYWLCWKALNEWDIEDGETYYIVCAANMLSDEYLMIIATIEDGGQSFSWWGKLVSIRD